MMENEQERMQQLLRKTMQPVAGRAGAELRRDLWPKVPWFDWALLGAVAVWLVFFPGAIPLLLYYL